MVTNKILKIDIRTHYKLNHAGLMNDANDELIIQNNYELYLHRAAIELLNRAVIEGLFDNAKQTNISFRKIPYDENEKERALCFLQNKYMVTHNWDFKGAHDIALLQYEKINPFNLVMLVEMVREN